MNRSKITKYSVLGLLGLIVITLIIGYWIIPDIRLKDIDGYIITSGLQTVVCEEYQSDMYSSGLWTKCTKCWERDFGGWKRAGNVNLQNVNTIKRTRPPMVNDMVTNGN